MSTKTQPETLDAVIAQIYDAALDATKWPKALGSIAEVARCAASEFCSSMTTYGTGYRLTAKVLDGRQTSANSALRRTLKQPAATTQQITLLKRLTPHLRRAMQIGQQLGHMNQHLKIFQELVDRLPIGVIILNNAGTIEFMNREAVRIGSGADGLIIRMNSVSAHYRAENAVLRGFISESLQAGGQRSGHCRRHSQRLASVRTQSLLGPGLPSAATPHAHVAGPLGGRDIRHRSGATTRRACGAGSASLWVDRKRRPPGCGTGSRCFPRRLCPSRIGDAQYRPGTPEEHLRQDRNP